jgi:small subunit ribosomal protein S3
MGRKVHPMGFRIGVIRDWQSKWYDEAHYADFILEDFNLRKAIKKKYPEASISQIEIERQANKVGVTVHTARPGIVIGRGGQRVEEMRQYLEGFLGGRKVQLDVREIRQPELDAYLVARSIAEQMERRVAYRRAMKQTIFRSMQAGAKGMRIVCSGRLGGVEIARRQMMHQGRVPLQTLRADIDYGFTEAHTTFGRIGVKVWVYRGDIFAEVEAKPAPPVATAAPPVEIPVPIVAIGAKTALEVPIEAIKEAHEASVETKKPRAKRKTAETPIEEAAKPAEEMPSKAKEVAKPRTRVKKTTTEEVAQVAKAEVVAEKPAKTKATKAKATEAKESKPRAKKE